jgi:formylglycine-generating enzyme required for sulfatase activity
MSERSESQWEYACPAGTTTRFNFGIANNGAECNCNGQDPLATDVKGPALSGPAPVGSYRPNAFGLYDMHGNVWEWCWDGYDEAYYKHSPKSDPVGPPKGSDRVPRGGGWLESASLCRSAHRRGYSPDCRYDSLGFRLARSSGE